MRLPGNLLPYLTLICKGCGGKLYLSKVFRTAKLFQITVIEAAAISDSVMSPVKSGAWQAHKDMCRL